MTSGVAEPRRSTRLVRRRGDDSYLRAVRLIRRALTSWGSSSTIRSGPRAPPRVPGRPITMVRPPLAQRGQVADAEVVGRRGVDLLRWIDVAVGPCVGARFGGHVDQFDLVGGAERRHRAWSPVRHAGDLRYDVVERLGCWMLTVVMTSMPASISTWMSSQRFSCDHGDVRVREFVDQRDGGLPCQNGVDVHFRELGITIRAGQSRDASRSSRSAAVWRDVRLDEGDDDVRCRDPFRRRPSSSHLEVADAGAAPR